jgi:hypothetical protein
MMNDEWSVECGVQPETINHKPETTNPKQQTRNHKPETSNPKLQTRNHKQKTIKGNGEAMYLPAGLPVKAIQARQAGKAEMLHAFY